MAGSDLTSAAHRVVERCYADWKGKHEHLQAMVAMAVRDKTYLAGDYWQSEWRARKRLEAAASVEAAIVQAAAEERCEPS